MTHLINLELYTLVNYRILHELALPISKARYELTKSIQNYVVNSDSLRLSFNILCTPNDPYALRLAKVHDTSKNNKFLTLVDVCTLYIRLYNDTNKDMVNTVFYNVNGCFTSNEKDFIQMLNHTYPTEDNYIYVLPE